MTAKPKMDSHVFDKDVLLCESTSRRAADHAKQILLEEEIPFSGSWRSIPFFQRSRYSGASEICRIVINRNEYAKARRAISRLDDRFYSRLLLNVI